MISLIQHTVLPAGYQALSRAVYSTQLLASDPLAVLESINGTAVKEWIQSKEVSANALTPTLMAGIHHLRQLPWAFAEALPSSLPTMYLAGCFFGSSYVLEKALDKVAGKVSKCMQPPNFVVKAIALAGVGAVILTADHNYHLLNTNVTQLAEITARVYLAAFASKIAIRGVQLSLDGVGKLLEFFVFPPSENSPVAVFDIKPKAPAISVKDKGVVSSPPEKPAAKTKPKVPEKSVSATDADADADSLGKNTATQFNSPVARTNTPPVSPPLSDDEDKSGDDD